MRTFLLITISLLFFALQWLHESYFQGFSKHETIITLGFLLLAGFLLGSLFPKLHLPKLTGYIIAGILFGPYFLNFLSESSITGLKLIDTLALNIIAFIAGGELKLKHIAEHKKSLTYTIIAQIFIIIIGVSLTVYLISPYIPFLAEQEKEVILAAGLLFGTIAVAKSPATAIAVISETRAKGEMTNMLITVTVAIDVLIIILFSMAISAAEIITVPNAQISSVFWLKLLWELAGAILLGVLVGFGVIIYIKYYNKELPLFLIALAFVLALLADITHTDTILICLAAGFVVENYSQRGDSFIQGIEKGSLIIFIIFFVIAGANLNIEALKEGWLLAMALVLVRIFFTYVSTRSGLMFIPTVPQTVKNLSWAGFISQAGVSLGLALLIEKRLDNEIGNYVTTIIFATIAINQIIGPIMLKYALSKGGETQT